GRHVLAYERTVALEAAGGQHHGHALRQLMQRLAQPHRSCARHKQLGERPRVEAAAHGERITGIALLNRRPQLLEPVERVVEALVDDPLELRIAARALRAEALEVTVAPDEATRQEHRAARPVALL